MSTSKKSDSYRDQIATVDKSGKRIWIYPKKPKGWYYDKRKIISYLLLLFLFGMPFVKMGGEPFFLFNVLERRFTLFGMHFAPQDFHLFVFGMLIFILFIVVFTLVYGRLFCGWICPQTIFMEMVFRRIEYLIEGDANAQKRLNKAPWTAEKTIKKVSKQIIFFLIAVLVANTFLAWVIGVDEVWKIATEPVSMHVGGFVAMIFFSFAFYFVFSQLREQVCVTICPYGRMQGVLLDKNSIAVYYDFERGEPRGKIKKKRKKSVVKPLLETMAVAATTTPSPIDEGPVLGDCIDCKLCVQVCPTGIDIRDGVQLECVNCTACMDACDEVMEKVGRPKALIRYDSYNGIKENRRQWFTPRVRLFSAVLVLLLAAEVFLLVGRTDVETILLRTPGMLYQETEEGYISNLYNYQIINKTSDEFPVELKLLNEGGRIRFVGKPPVSKPNDISEGSLFIDMPPDLLDSRKTKLRVGVLVNGEQIDVVKTNFLGPVK